MLTLLLRRVKSVRCGGSDGPGDIGGSSGSSPYPAHISVPPSYVTVRGRYRNLERGGRYVYCRLLFRQHEINPIPPHDTPIPPTYNQRPSSHDLAPEALASATRQGRGSRKEKGGREGRDTISDHFSSLNFVGFE